MTLSADAPRTDDHPPTHHLTDGHLTDSGHPVDAAEWAVRTDLAVAYRMFHHWGWDDLIYTHLSARVPGPDHHFLLNPYDLGFDEITPANLVKVDLDGDPVTPTEHQTNPAGFVIHSAVHAARESAQCVMHLHTPDGQAVSAQAHGVLPICQTSMFVHGLGLAYHDFEGTALDLDERDRLVADLGENNLMLLRNHGTLAVGASVGEAFTSMYYFERACQVQVRALTADLVSASSEAIAYTASIGAGPLIDANVTLAWPMVKRRAHRLFPDLGELAS